MKILTAVLVASLLLACSDSRATEAISPESTERRPPPGEVGDEPAAPDQPSGPVEVLDESELATEPVERPRTEAQVCNRFAETTYVPFMSSILLERSDGLQVAMQHASNRAHGVYVLSSDSRYDEDLIFPQPEHHLYPGQLILVMASTSGYRIQLDPVQSYVVQGPVDKVILVMCADMWRQVGGRTDIWRR